MFAFDSLVIRYTQKKNKENWKVERILRFLSIIQKKYAHAFLIISDGVKNQLISDLLLS
jgi:hypothetical protein